MAHAQLIGRDAELGAVDRLLAEARSERGGAVVVRGEAGVGKSALLEHARSSADGMIVLRATGVEGESELAYAALHQLLRPVLDRLPALPEPQAAALRSAFALSDETVDERFRVSLGVLSLLSDLTQDGSVLCLIDDAQWLDQASAEALLFVARRVQVDPVALLFAARDDDDHPFVAPGLPELRVPPLDGADSRLLLADRLGSTVRAGVADWLLERANGNPLALLELPAALSPGQLAGVDPIPADLVPATSIEQVFLGRVNGLPPPVQTLLLLAAAEATGTRATVERAAGELGLDLGELGAAESAGLVSVGGDRIAFRHPLVRSAVYRGARFTDRERVHGALAAALSGTGEADRRAWHRAAATVGVDEEVADELERTAERARLRSGYAAASAALERAAELTADPGARARRLVGAVSAAWHAGDPERALALAGKASGLATEPKLRAELEHVRGDIEHRRGRLQTAGEILMAGAEVAGPVDPPKALEMLFDAASCGMQTGDFALVAAAGQRAATLPASADERERFLADLLIGVGSMWLETSAAEIPLVLDVIERARAFDEPRLLTGAAMGASTIGDETAEAALLARAVRLARESGAVDAVSLALLATAVAGVLGGRLTVDAEAAEGLRLARESRLTGVAGLQLAIAAWFAAVRGDELECRTAAAEVSTYAAETGNALANSIAVWALALLELSQGQYEEAASRLLALGAAPAGVAHPLILLLATPDLVEACVRAGRRDEAGAAYAALDGFARGGAPAWALAVAARCRALMADTTAAEEFEDALRLHAEAQRPFDRARTELLYGAFLRRERRRRDAREHLRSALAAFERLRADVWADRARAELRATGETARRRDASTADQLTPQELQIARLVGEGASNKDVAAQLFLSPRTVEYHLRKVFTKLGISSRAELIRQGVGVEPQAVGMSASD